MLDESEIVAQFDRLVADGVIFYDYEQKIERLDVEGLQMEFRISKALIKKPSAPSSGMAETRMEERTIPGSDLVVTGCEIEPLGDTHLLTFNMFCPHRPSFLILTQDGYKRQWEALDLDDLKTAHTVLTSLTSDHLLFFNCGAEAGCSRVHKHMQAVPSESSDPWQNVTTAGVEIFTKRHGPAFPSPEELLASYAELLQAARQVLGAKDDQVPPHNMVLDRTGIMVIPRRNAGLGKLGANSCGMLGMQWVATEETMQQWIEAGPRKVIANAGVPKK